MAPTKTLQGGIPPIVATEELRNQGRPSDAGSHVHMVNSIPPKHAVSSIIGFLKGKSSIWIAQSVSNNKKDFIGTL